MGLKNNKKRIRKKRIYIFSILCVSILFLLVLMLTLILSNRDYYQQESRIKNIEENKKKNDTDEFETVGWLKIQGTNIDYPIITSKEDEADFPVTMESYGWVPYWDGKLYKKIDIGGHNIFNLSSKPTISSKRFKRFEELLSFVYYDFARKNKYIQYTSNGVDYVYKIFSVNFIDSQTINSFPSTEYYTNDIIDSQIKKFEKESLYKYDVDVNKKDKLISLVTCTRFFGANSDYSFVVTGRLLRKNEKIRDYKVTKNNNVYSKIEKIMSENESGDESEEL